MKNRLNDYSLDKTKRIALLAFYFFGFIVVFPLLFSSILLKLNLVNDLLFMLFVYLSSVLIVIALAKPLFKSEQNVSWSKMLQYIVINIFLLFIINAIIGRLIEVLFSLSTSENQQAIYNMLSLSNYGENVEFIIPYIPYIAFITLVILAPILEEVIFRGVVFRWMRQSYSFIISSLVSGMLFGFIHVMDSLLTGNYLDLVYILLYGIMGVVFSKMYEETGSIYGPIILHACYNAIPTLALILT